MPTTDLRAVFWDFGGVILSSPFEAFNDYEAAHGLPTDFIRSVNARNPLDNAWALIERHDIDAATFDARFADESAALGHRIPGRDVLALLQGSVRPEMVAELDRVIAAGYIAACLTNNVTSNETRPDVAAVMERFDHVIESSRAGCRKPELEFYELACRTVAVRPDECVFLDDLGVNLKPARAMGMTTIKVVTVDRAIADLRSTLEDRGWRRDDVAADGARSFAARCPLPTQVVLDPRCN